MLLLALFICFHRYFGQTTSLSASFILPSAVPITASSSGPTDTMATCQLADYFHIHNHPGKANEVWCTNKNHVCPNWNVVVLIALKQQNQADLWTKIKNITEYMNEVLVECSTASRFIVLTPTRPADQHSCEPQATNKSGLATITTVINPSNSVFNTTTDEGDELVRLFQDMENCPSYYIKEETMLEKTAGMVLLFTDVDCKDICVNSTVLAMDSLIDNITASEYNLRLIRVGIDSNETSPAPFPNKTDNSLSDCFTSIFSRCEIYDGAICMMGMYDSVYSAVNDDNQKFCHLDVTTKSGFPTLWIIISSVVAFLIIIGCVGIRCFFRYKALKQGNKWSWFVWKSPEDGILPGVSNGKAQSAAPNDYNEVTREPDLWEVLPENLILNESDILGSGAFATVYLGKVKGDLPLAKMNNGALKLGIRKDSDGTYKVAVKRLPPHATAEGRLDFNHEIEFMKELGYHPHVLSLLGVVNSTHDAMIIVENCECGDLLSFVRSRKESFSLCPSNNMEHFGQTLRIKELISIAWQISDGMSYMFNKNFIHRDIAARNILLTKSMVAKIGDFGLCRLVDSSLYTAKGGRLPIKWMAPESLKYYEYSLKSDVWSFGVLLWELFSLGEAPYNTIQPSEMPKYLDEGNRLPQPENTCPNEIYDIMLKCWQKQHDERPDIDSIREDLTQLLNNDSSSYGYLAMFDFDDTEVCEI